MRSLSIPLLIALLEVPLLPALSAAASGEQASPGHYSRIPPVHRAIHPLDGPWPDRRSAAKSLEVCPSMDIPSLQADALVDYLRSTSHHCVEQSLLSRDPDYRRAWPVVFGDANMQSVFAEIERLAPSYDGTDDSGMLNLWFFVGSGYELYRWFPGTGVGPFNDATVQAFLDASDASEPATIFWTPVESSTNTSRPGMRLACKRSIWLRSIGRYPNSILTIQGVYPFSIESLPAPMQHSVTTATGCLSSSRRPLKIRHSS